MQDMVSVTLKEDDSVQRKIEKTALRLNKKFSKRRRVNEAKLLKPKSKVRKVFSIIIDTVLIGICVLCCMFGMSSFIFKMNRLPPTFAGYSFMQISSGSMIADGFDIGDAIVVKKVDTKTLNVGDNIAFYVYPTDYKTFNKDSATLVEKEETQHNHSMSFGQFFGVPSKEMSAAAKAHSRLVFHKITKIYQDEQGMYWFTTKGSSNALEDYWHVSERMVIGVYDNSAGAKVFSSILQLLSGSMGTIIVISIPILVLSAMFVAKCIKRVQIARLELDCIEEKRKITDEICVRNDIGFNMTKNDKYKILVQAPPEKREEYLALLWKDGSAPSSIHKYVIRKNLTLKPMEKMLELNRLCEKMHAAGVDPEEIAKHYLVKKSAIEKEQQRYKKIFKALRKKNQQEKDNKQRLEQTQTSQQDVEVKAVQEVQAAVEIQPAPSVAHEVKEEKVAPKKTAAKPAAKNTASSKAATAAKKTTKAAEPKAAAKKKTATKPATTKVADEKSAATKKVSTKAVAAKPAATKPAVTKTATTANKTTKTASAKTAAEKKVATKSATSKAKSTTTKTSAAKATKAAKTNK
ncbi:MAG: hypothetical protein J6A28_03675 [Clostridia bacterium]|nr:hypothetical protein [Clostridia bacterium]